MTRLTRLALVLAAAVIAALLSVHVVSAATAGDPGSPIAKVSAGLATFTGVGGPASTPTSDPSYGSSSATSSSTTAQPGDQQPGYQATNDPQGQEANEPQDQEANEPQGQEANEPQGQEVNEPQITGSVQSIDSANHAFTLTLANGTVSVLTNAQTEFKDGLNGFGDVKSGMTVTVDGMQQGNGTLLATETKGSVESPESDTSSTQASGD